MSHVKYDFRNFTNIRSAASPSFSHDGKYVFFLTNITGVPQVWRVSIDGGWPEQLTYFDERVKRVLCSPKDDIVVFELDIGGSERDQIYLLSLKNGLITPFVVEPDIIHELGPWSYDGKLVSYRSNLRHQAFFDVYVANAQTGETQRVYERDETNSPDAWSHNGRFLVIKRENTNLDNDLSLLDLKTGEVRCLTPHEGEASYYDTVFIPNDTSIFCLTNRGREFIALVSIDLKTCEERAIVEERWDLESLALTPNGDIAAYAVNEEGYSKLKIINLANREIEDVDGLPKGVVSEAKWSPNGRYLAFTFSGSVFNSDIWLYDEKKKEVFQLTKSDRGGIPQKEFVEPELVHYKSFDGLNIPSFLYMPKGLNKPPVVVNVHGGAEMQFRPSFNAVIQFFVNNGFAVFSPNVRGSSGYGKTFNHLDDVEKRVDAVHDLKYAHKWLVESNRVDSKRIAIYGGSYGGFMVLAALTTFPELWAAGIDLYGIANFITFLNNTGPWRRRERTFEYGDPVKDAVFLKKLSPIYRADKIVAPLLVVHGANDPRVPKSETDQIVEALKKRGIPVDYILFNDEGHGIVKLKNRLATYSAIISFLQKYLTSKN